MSQIFSTPPAAPKSVRLWSTLGETPHSFTHITLHHCRWLRQFVDFSLSWSALPRVSFPSPVLFWVFWVPLFDRDSEDRQEMQEKKHAVDLCQLAAQGVCGHVVFALTVRVSGRPVRLVLMTPSHPRTHNNSMDQMVPIPHWKFLHFKKKEEALFQTITSNCFCHYFQMVAMLLVACHIRPSSSSASRSDLFPFLCAHSSNLSSGLPFLTCPPVVTIEYPATAHLSSLTALHQQAVTMFL